MGQLERGGRVLWVRGDDRHGYREIGLDFLVGGQRVVSQLHPRCWLAWEEVRAGMA